MHGLKNDSGTYRPKYVIVERLIVYFSFFNLTILPVVMKIFLTTVMEKVSREIRRSEMCPPPREAKKRARGGKEEAKPFCKIMIILYHLNIHLNGKSHHQYVKRFF